MSGFRYYRIINIRNHQLINTSNYTALSVSILNFFDVNNTIRSVNGTPIAYNYYKTTVPENAFDNNELTLYHCDFEAGHGINSSNWQKLYIGYISPEPFVLKYIEYKPRTDELLAKQEWLTSTIECSNDGIVWNKYSEFNPQRNVGDNSTEIYTINSAYDLNIIIYNEYYKADIIARDLTRYINHTCKPNMVLGVYEKNSKTLIYVARSNEVGFYYFDRLDKNKGYYVVDEQHCIVYDTDYEGKETIKGFVEGVTKPVNVILTDKHGNELEQQLTTDFEFLNYNTTNLNGNIKIGGTLTPVEYYIGQTRGYISASVVITECLDSDFVIHCFRSSDKQFIGEYPIIDDRYTIDNLNLTQTYDIMLYDKNKVVETQVHSRRTPSIYQ